MYTTTAATTAQKGGSGLTHIIILDDRMGGVLGVPKTSTQSDADLFSEAMRVIEPMATVKLRALKRSKGEWAYAATTIVIWSDNTRDGVLVSYGVGLNGGESITGATAVPIRDNEMTLHPKGQLWTGGANCGAGSAEKTSAYYAGILGRGQGGTTALYGVVVLDAAPMMEKKCCSACAKHLAENGYFCQGFAHAHPMLADSIVRDLPSYFRAALLKKQSDARKSAERRHLDRMLSKAKDIKRKLLDLGITNERLATPSDVANRDTDQLAREQERTNLEAPPGLITATTLSLRQLRIDPSLGKTIIEVIIKLAHNEITPEVAKQKIAQIIYQKTDADALRRINTFLYALTLWCDEETCRPGDIPGILGVKRVMEAGIAARKQQVKPQSQIQQQLQSQSSPAVVQQQQPQTVQLEPQRLQQQPTIPHTQSIEPLPAALEKTIIEAIQQLSGYEDISVDRILDSIAFYREHRMNIDNWKSVSDGARSTMADVILRHAKEVRDKAKVAITDTPAPPVLGSTTVLSSSALQPQKQGLQQAPLQQQQPIQPVQPPQSSQHPAQQPHGLQSDNARTIDSAIYIGQYGDAFDLAGRDPKVFAEAVLKRGEKFVIETVVNWVKNTQLHRKPIDELKVQEILSKLKAHGEKKDDHDEPTPTTCASSSKW